jgi:hypothetical protein
MPEPHLRAGDADREAVATALGEHMAAGRLTLAEFDERLARAYAATTYGELAELTADLPSPTPSGATVATPAPDAPAPAAVAHRRTPLPLPLPWAAHGLGHGPLEHSWRAWLSTSVTVLVVYLVVSLASWEFSYFWPIWVIGPWGAALLVSRLGGTGARGEDGRPPIGR